jgi:EAL domain-containing protein (putative c-di-GMP-specific phosphodiesterase class I)
MSDAVNRRVLVIDDNEAIHRDFTKVLRPADGDPDLASAEAALFGSSADAPAEVQSFEVDCALLGRRGCELALEPLAAGRPHALAFVDMRMPPGWDGVHTIERLWQCDPELQVVICTVVSDQSWEEIAARLGRSDNLLLLKKPFDNVEVWQTACSLTEKWALRRRAAAKLRESENLADQFYVSVNVSRRQLMDPELVPAVRSVLNSHELAAAWLNLEVTEGDVIEGFETAKRRLAELKQLGVGLHMDDFGTGYSSLSCLHLLPFDVVKIDRSFTASMRENVSYAAVIRAVVTLARSLKMKVTVEGVETPEQLELVTELGCDFAQGFLFSKAVEADAVTAMLQARRRDAVAAH